MKPKREAEVAPKVRIDSPTTVNTSTGFHLLEFHGPMVSNIVILGSLACLTGWYSYTATSARSGGERRQDCEGAEEQTQKPVWLFHTNASR